MSPGAQAPHVSEVERGKGCGIMMKVLRREESISVMCLLSPGRSEPGDGMLPSLLASPSPDILSVLTCERASQQLTGKLNFYKYGHFLPSSFLR